MVLQQRRDVLDNVARFPCCGSREKSKNAFGGQECILDPSEGGLGSHSMLVLLETAVIVIDEYGAIVGSDARDSFHQPHKQHVLAYPITLESKL